MDHLFFTIFFTYDIHPTTMQVDLCAAIEMIDGDNCIVRGIRRVDTDESPLLPVLILKKSAAGWRHTDSGKESNIATSIGQAIEKHMKEISKSRDEIKNN